MALFTLCVSWGKVEEVSSKGETPKKGENAELHEKKKKKMEKRLLKKTVKSEQERTTGINIKNRL